MLTGHDLEHVLFAEPTRPPISRALTPLQRAATITGAAYLITLALFGVAGSTLGMLYLLSHDLFPVSVGAAAATIIARPAFPLALLAVTFVPIFSIELTLGLWLLVKGVRVPRLAASTSGSEQDPI